MDGIPIPTLPNIPLQALRGTNAEQLPTGLTFGGLTSSWHPAGSSRWNRKRTPCCNYPPISAVYPRNKLIAAVKPPSHRVQEESMEGRNVSQLVSGQITGQWPTGIPCFTLSGGRLSGLAADHLPGISSCLSYKTPKCHTLNQCFLGGLAEMW